MELAADRNICLSIIIPCYNESENIDFLVNSLNNYFRENGHIKAEILFIDDASEDDTSDRIKRAKHINYEPKLIKLAKNTGSHIAFRVGCLNSRYDLVTQTSADLQHPLNLINEMYLELKKGFHVVIALRKHQLRMGLFEKLLSKLYTQLIVKYAMPNYPEGGFDLFMIDGKIKKLFNDNVEANSSILLQLLSFGFRLGVVKYDKNDRKFGQSKWSFRKKLKLMIDSFVGYSYTPIRFVTLAGILIFLVGIFWTINIVLRKYIYQDVAQGWTALSCILLIGFGITNISIGILAEYLWRTLDAARRRPVFIIDDIVELPKYEINNDDLQTF
ncbi:MAG: glycosyltransferase [Bacteroidota bacterium]|jgi:glycosyltransferase involved in cell wall biosynthesis